MSSRAETTAASREGLKLRTRWFGSEFIPFDEMLALDERGVQLRSGSARPLPVDLRPAAEQALNPPEVTGRPAADAQAWLRYMAGAWSPLRAAGLLLAMAAACRASDVHIEATASGHQVRIRQVGTMVDFASLERVTGRRLLAALKHLAGCLPYRSDVVQEGRISRDGVAADVRAAFMPTALGERVALRLFGQLLTLPELGLSANLQRDFAAMLRHRSGLVLVAGPSGGGKTTTVYAALAFVASQRGGAHLSIEDPVEQRLRLAGVPVDQVELMPERGLTAEAALVAALRQDVDVVALAEIRTPAEARLAVEAAHTGRLVVAGIHAGSTQEARQRMSDLGVELSVFDMTLRGVLHQSLERVSCPDCTPADCARCGGLGHLRAPRASLWVAKESA